MREDVKKKWEGTGENELSQHLLWGHRSHIFEATTSLSFLDRILARGSLHSRTLGAMRHPG